jgi:uncharacterized protein with PIN domain
MRIARRDVSGQNPRPTARTIGAGLGEVKKTSLQFPSMKECPLCGESMRLSVREITERVPGVSAPTTRIAREWICPECDYFEEAEAGEG